MRKADHNENLRPASNVGRKRGKSAQTPKVVEKLHSGSKSAKIVELLSRTEGVTLSELIEVTKWQPHSVRGFLSGTVRKKMGIKLTSDKRHDGERVYKISARQGRRSQ